MLLECNRIGTLIVNLEHIPAVLDEQLSQLLDVAPCIFIVSAGSRRDNLRALYPECQFFRPVFHLTTDMFLKKVLQDLGINPYEAVFITGNPDQVYFASLIGLATILFNPDEEDVDRTRMPDYEVSGMESLMECLREEMYGYFGELKAHAISGTGIFKAFDIKHEIVPEISAKLIVGGRYFTSNDRRAYIHPLTNKILQMKSGYQKEPMAELLATSFEVLERNNKVDYLTLVPPRPGQSSKLLSVFNEASRVSEDPIQASKLQPNLLKTIRNYDPQKSVGSWINRALNVFGAFKVNQPVSGHIAIFDDIVTSGSTALECARMLYEAGADEVSIIALGSSQERIPSHSKRLKCDRDGCDGEYFLRFNRQKQTPFFGCSNYQKCGNNGVTFQKGRQDYNSQNAFNTTGDSDSDDSL